MSALATRLDAQTELLVVLLETQIEHRDRLGTPAANVQGVVAEVRQGFGALATGQVEITALLKRLLSDGNE